MKSLLLYLKPIEINSRITNMKSLSPGSIFHLISDSHNSKYILIKNYETFCTVISLLGSNRPGWLRHENVTKNTLTYLGNETVTKDMKEKAETYRSTYLSYKK